MRAAWRFIASFLVLAAPLSAAAFVTTVDATGDVGAYPSMRLNAGRPVISYQDVGNGDLKLATCTSGCDTPTPAWVITTIDSSGNAGAMNSMQLNNGNPVVSYYDWTNEDLKLATCTANCASSSPSWVIVTVDSAGDVGRLSSLQLNNGNPVISYFDQTNGRLKLATCTANCATSSPTWLITVVDSTSSALTGWDTSLQLNGGNPVISYHDRGNGTLRLATCTANCASASPTWVLALVDGGSGIAGRYNSLRLNGGNPVISYHDEVARHLKLATCTANCASSSPSWVIVTVDEAGSGLWTSLQLDEGRPVVSYYGSSRLRLAACTGGCATSSPTWSISTLDVGFDTNWDSDLQLAGRNAFVSYYDTFYGDLRLAYAPIVRSTEVANYQGLWWRPEGRESGWGLNIAHQGDILFMTWFTYDITSSPMWLVMSEGRKSSHGIYSGDLYRTTGPAFSTSPWTGGVSLSKVGRATFTFDDEGTKGEFRFTVNNLTAWGPITRQVFASPVPQCTAGSSPSTTNYQDLWWGAPAGSESGWGVNIAHQGDVVFATWFTYAPGGTGMWYVMSDGRRTGTGRFSGTLYRTTGPGYNRIGDWNPALVTVTPVGTGTFAFSDASNGTFAYTVDGVSQTKAITRQVFSAPTTVCR